MSYKINETTIYTVKEVAELLNVSDQTVRKYIHNGHIKAGRLGRPVVISEDSLNDFLNTQGITAETHEIPYYQK